MTFEESLTHIPDGWTFTHLILLDQGDWQCNLASPEAVVFGTGANPAQAVIMAIYKTVDRHNYLPLYDPTDHKFDDAKPLVDLVHISQQFQRQFFKPFRRRL